MSVWSLSLSVPVFSQSPDGKYLASGAIDGIINIFDIATGKLLHTLEGKITPRWREVWHVITCKDRNCKLFIFEFPLE